MIIRDHRDAAAAAVESSARRAEPCPGCGMPKGSGLGSHYALCPIDTAERARAEALRLARSVDVTLTPMALELKAYFRARQACIKADPPCAVRPCARHHAEAAAALGSVPCEVCEGVGLVGVDPEPCIRCDGFGRCW